MGMFVRRFEREDLVVCAQAAACAGERCCHRGCSLFRAANVAFEQYPTTVSDRLSQSDADEFLQQISTYQCSSNGGDRAARTVIRVASVLSGLASVIADSEHLPAKSLPQVHDDIVNAMASACVALETNALDHRDGRNT